MRKIIYRRKKDERDPLMLNGSSNSCGVLMQFCMHFTEQKIKNVSVKPSFKLPPTYAYVGRNGEVKTEPEEGQRIVERERDKSIEDGKKTMDLKLSLFICAIVTFVTSIVGLISTKGDVSVFRLFGATMVIYGLFKIPQYIRDVISRITEKEDFMKFTKFHAAEHRVINAYNHLKRVPTMEELNNYSNHSYYCMYSSETSAGWFWIAGGICWMLFGTGAVWLAGITFIILTFVFESTGYLPLGAIYVSEPDEIHLKTALTALEEVVEGRVKSEDIIGNVSDIKIFVHVSEDGDGRDFPSGIIISMGDEFDDDSDDNDSKD